MQRFELLACGKIEVCIRIQSQAVPPEWKGCAWLGRNVRPTAKGKVIFFFNWRKIALQCYVSFCCTTTWISYKIISVQSLSCVRLFATPWTSACQAFLSITISWSLLKLMSIESVMPSNHLILCHPLLLLPSIFPSIKVLSTEPVLLIRWPKYWSFTFSIRLSKEYSALISFRIDWFDLGAV